MDKLIEKIKNQGLKGTVTIPPDKSISHRSLIFSALIKDKIKIKNLSKGKDCLATLKILEKSGVKYEFLSDSEIISDSTGAFKTKEALTLDCENSGTSARLLTGLFSALDGLNVTLVGDKSLSCRPMGRIIKPLSLMGADIKSNENKLPLTIKGKKLNPITYFSPVSSAQVKSALILAGINSNDYTTIYEQSLSRNHSELMLEYLGADIISGKDEKGYYTKIKKSKLLKKDIEIAGDISSASFFLCAGAIIKNSEIVVKNVGINPTRTGILDVFNQAGVNYQILNKRTVCSEPVADIKVKYSENLKPFEIKGDLIPRLIDEIPILSILALCANGKTVIKDAGDLRNKESDRIKTMVETFKNLEVDVIEKPDGFIIEGGRKINKELTLKTHLDHRLAMSYFVLSLINEKQTIIEDFKCSETSFPEFLDKFKELIK